MLSLNGLKKKLYFFVARYFKFWANISLKRWNPRIFALTGSVGKTTLLNLTEVQLGNKAHYSHNANSVFGIAFDILGLTGITGSKLKWFYLFFAAPIKSFFFTHTESIFVVEIDGERPHETEMLASWLKPELTFWVSFGRSHAVQFDKQVKEGKFKNVDEAILHEFAFLPKYTTQAIIYNANDANIEKAIKDLNIKKYPITKNALKHYEVWPNKTEINVNNTTFTFNEPVPSEIYVQLAMIENLAKYLNEKPVTNFSGFIQPPGRSNFYKGIKSTNLIDSSYNAHLISMRSIIDLYKKMQTSTKWVVIGDIVDQGQTEAEQHSELGEILNNANFDRYIFVGRRTQAYTYSKLDPKKAVTFLHPKDALKYLKNEIKGNETILFKGSQYLEGIIADLLEDKSDVKNLPRQDEAAKKRRAKWGLK